MSINQPRLQGILPIAGRFRLLIDNRSVIKIYDFQRGPNGEVEVNDALFVRKLRASADVRRTYGKLAGDFVVIFDSKGMRLLNWKEEMCASVDTVSELYPPFVTVMII